MRDSVLGSGIQYIGSILIRCTGSSYDDDRLGGCKRVLG